MIEDLSFTNEKRLGILGGWQEVFNLSLHKDQ